MIDRTKAFTNLVHAVGWRHINGPLFRKYVALFLAVVFVVLLIDVLIEIGFAYQQHKVSLELPLEEAYAPLYQALERSGALLLAGLVLAFLAALFLARRMVVPIQTIRAGAARIGSGDLTQRISIRTGDELEALAEQFNRMAEQLQENVAATREHLLAAARKHFGRHGYSRAEIGRIAAEARVTTGAVYHHFSGNKGLFQATAERIEAEILAQASIVDEANPWLRLRLGFEKLVDFCAAADVHRIIFVEAPQVIGPEAWREIELR